MRRKIGVFATAILCLFLWAGLCSAAQKKGKVRGAAKFKISPETQTCIDCHNNYTPGIVKDWLGSRHAKNTPAEAMKKPALQRRMSAKIAPEGPANYVVGCYECHSRNAEAHKDNFEHNGFRINVVVSPRDCRVCHPVEADQYAGSKKAQAHKNLMANPVYHALAAEVTGLKKIDAGRIASQRPSEATLRETCLGCHGTRIEVRGFKKVSTAAGEMEFPDLTSWPNQGVGRENPDGSLGSCTACHPRHSFSIKVARKPYTCAQCHLEPDVPAWNVYKSSKHGNIFSSAYKEWNFDRVPWTVGRDFTAPTCAACHNSLVVSPRGEIVSERTHDFGSRLWVRIFGLIYSHPQPKSGDTTILRNKDGLPLPATFHGERAGEGLIGKEEQDRRLQKMENICSSCHTRNWTNGHFGKFESTNRETDALVLAATAVLGETWEKGLEDKANPFDESIEKMWVRQWLFYANTVRYSSAMTGAQDYATFQHGWWDLTENLRRMKDMMELKSKIGK